MTNRRQIYASDADWEAVDALARQWKLFRTQHGVEVPNHSAAVVRAIREALDE